MTLPKINPPVRIVAKIPPDVKLWLSKRAEHFGATIGSEVARCCRSVMEQEAAASRKRTRAAATEPTI